MIKLFFMLGVTVLSCGPAKTGHAEPKTDSMKTDQHSVVIQDVTDTVAPKNAKTAAKNKTTGKDSIPACIKQMIETAKKAPKHEQNQKIIEYDYRGKKVYYVMKPCCDFFNEVYDENCKLLGAPDGGFTGKGDGKLPDFFKEAKNEKVIFDAAGTK